MLRKTILGFVLLLVGLPGYGQEPYSIDVSGVKTGVIRHHLDLGGSNAEGDSIAVNSFYIERRGEPYIPVIGEFHYARFPRQYWDEEIKKIKAGGVSVVAYVFWILRFKGRVRLERRPGSSLFAGVRAERAGYYCV